MTWKAPQGRTDLWSGEGRQFRTWMTGRSEETEPRAGEGGQFRAWMRGKPKETWLAERPVVRRKHVAWRKPVMAAAATAIVLAAVVTLPVVATPRCEGLVTWQMEPVACWRWSWAALLSALSQT